MTDDRTTEIEPRLAAYIDDTWTREHEAAARLATATAEQEASGMKSGADQGRLLFWLLRTIGARRTIEVGVYTGYSALWTALALPADGYVLACDVSTQWTDVGRPFWAEAGVDDRIDLRIGPALDTLRDALDDGGADTFDFAFIDADKPAYDEYYELCLRLVRPGGVIGIDNVLWGGSVADPTDTTASTEAIRALNAKIASDDRVEQCLVPIGDGLTLVRRIT